MKAIIIIYVALLPSIIHGVSGDDNLNRNRRRAPVRTVNTPNAQVNEIDQARILLDEMVTNGANISNIFKPTAFVEQLTYFIIYKGELIRNNNQIVAMKFASSARNDLRLEYEMYTYLNAINDSAVENYGIPAVYYYGRWEDYLMLATTLLKLKVDLQYSYEFDLRHQMDIMILFREFVRISKYTHSRGVFHNQFVIWMMRFRGNKGFITDFSWASRVTDWQDGDGRKKEWENFFFNVVRNGRISPEIVEPLPERGLKKVLLKFNYYAREDQVQVDYDEMYDIIVEEIRILEGQVPASVSWFINAQHTSGASAEWSQNQTPDIRAIDGDPHATQFDYPAPNFAYFA